MKMLSFSGVSLLVIGDVMLDEYLSTSVGRISPEAPVPVAKVQRQWSVPGGAANVAHNLIALGCHVTLAGVRGADSSGNLLDETLKQLGILTCMECTRFLPTIRKSRIVAMGQQLLRLDREDTGSLPVEILDTLWRRVSAIIPNMNAVILSDYGKGVLLSRSDGDSLAARCITKCKELKIPVLVDPKGTDWGRYDGADCVTPNAKELEAVAGGDASDFDCLHEGASRLMREHAFKRILVTRSEQGMALFSSGGEVDNIPTVAREVSDVSGAGDTVISVLAACIATGMDWGKAARTANLAAGVVVGKIGTSPIELAELRLAMQMPQGANHHIVSRITSRIFDQRTLANVVDSWHRKGKRVVFTNGCFDLLHPGHVRLIEEAASQGDKLVVAINSDSSVSALKGPGRPIQNETARMTVMAALDGVDAAVLFDEPTPLRLIEILTPDVLVKGGDYTEEKVVGASHVVSHGGRVHIVRTVEGYSTTGIVSKITG